MLISCHHRAKTDFCEYCNPNRRAVLILTARQFSKLHDLTAVLRDQYILEFFGNVLARMTLGAVVNCTEWVQDIIKT